MRRLLIVILIIVPEFIKSQEMNLNGCYRNNNFHIYKFKKNKFEYFSVNNHIIKAGAGTFSILNDTIILDFYPDTAKFYSILISSTIPSNTDRVLFKLVDLKTLEPLTGAVITFNNENTELLLGPDGEMSIAKRNLPVKIKFVSCKSILLTENHFKKSNNISVKLNLSECYPKVEGQKKYPIKILKDTIKINNEILTIDKEGCNKIKEY